MAFGKKLTKGFAYGNALGFTMYVMGEVAKSAISVNVPLGILGYLIGLATSISIAIAEDEKEDKQ